METPLASQVSTLESVIHKLSKNDRFFAEGLIRSFNKYHSLSAKQEPWIGKLIAKASQAQWSENVPITVSIATGAGFQGVLKLFTQAKEHLKFPKIVLQVLGQTVVLSVAGPKSAAPGSINVTSVGKYLHREWYGRVSPEGLWVPSTKIAPEMRLAVEAMLAKFAANPAQVAKDYGTLTGNCCFCNKTLTDPHSTAAGFGPVCAKHYGLMQEWLKAPAKQAMKTPPLSYASAMEYGQKVAEAQDLVDADMATSPDVTMMASNGPDGMKTALHTALSTAKFQNMEFNAQELAEAAHAVITPAMEEWALNHLNTKPFTEGQEMVSACYLCEKHTDLLVAAKGFMICLECAKELEL